MAMARVVAQVAWEALPYLPCQYLLEKPNIYAPVLEQRPRCGHSLFHLKQLLVKSTPNCLQGGAYRICWVHILILAFCSRFAESSL